MGNWMIGSCVRQKKKRRERSLLRGDSLDVLSCVQSYGECVF